MGILKMAWRNIGRNRRRTAVTVGAMTLGLFAMVVYMAMMEGMLNDMEETIVEIDLGDLQIHAPTYLDDPSLYTVVDDVDALLGGLHAAGFRASARLVGAGLAAAHDSAAGASLRGVDVEDDARVSVIPTRLDEGAWLDEGDPFGVVVGRRLARSLNLALGDELVVLSQATDGGIANELYTVRGILGTVSDGVDRAAVFLTEGAFRDLFFMPSGAHEIVVRKPDELELDAALEVAQGLAPGLDTRSWRSLVPTIATYLDSARAAMGVVSAVVYIVIAILILNAMLMAVFERIREFGVLKALGVEPRQVVALIFVESALQTGLALAAGMMLTVPMLWYLSEFGIDTGGLGGVTVMGSTFATVWRRRRRRPRSSSDDDPGRAGPPGGDLSRPEGGPHQPGGGDAASVRRAR